MEEGAKFNATQEHIRKREEELLVTLRATRNMLIDEQKGGNGSSTKEIAALRQENKRLKAKMAKQEYRISHLVAEMENMLENGH